MKSAFNINWDKPSGRIYFAEHDHLIWLLKKCPNVIDAAMRHIQFASEDIKGQIHVSIQSHEAQYETNFFYYIKEKLLALLWRLLKIASMQMEKFMRFILLVANLNY